ILSYSIPAAFMGRGVLIFSTTEAFVLIALSRWLTAQFVSDDALKKRVLVLGTGTRAIKIATRMRRKSDQRAFVLVGFMEIEGSDPSVVRDGGGTLLRSELSLPDYCDQYRVQEIVVAMDERRRNQDAVGGLPLEELMECRLRGIEVVDVQQFIEREACKVDVDLLRPSWMVFADGFVANTWYAITKRAFDIFASLVLLLFTWPVILGASLMIWIGGRFREPVLYLQDRVGLDGQIFQVVKFRSMSTDAEKDGAAVWAAHGDPRITRIGAVIRKTRIDELPQLFNVLRGDMSFVGPRPERPEFVEELSRKIPFYDQRHRIKPGITGWAQLCYPYGATTGDAKEKLQYDLYYLKNHSILLDLIILVQTVEVVLVGGGAR
ncbi:MAG: TIGR03013 family PEP-CTERM/XrtA system glycosyltransferase, partial [Gammaproteobacteria bacterium]|nr:TIGR03013 family PEP-CTERM/XrtA system glycosyltransferase [Gammaproteobacteria bacterium]